MMIQTIEQLRTIIHDCGFIPLFDGSIGGFSVQAITRPYVWWTDRDDDPWKWRTELCRDSDIVYGKFFEKKAAFVSLNYFPALANYRRDGYDFDSRYEDAKASHREKLIMDLFTDDDTCLPSYIIKKNAGFGKDGEKGYEGTITNLQSETYLVVDKFDQKVKKNGEKYGWEVSYFKTAEAVIGSELIADAYETPPELSFEILADKLAKSCPNATRATIEHFLK